VVRHNAWRLRPCLPGAVSGPCELKTDPHFLCPPDGPAVLKDVAATKCHTLVVYGARSHAGMPPLALPASGQQAAQAAVLLNAAAHAASVAMVALPAGHYLLEDAPVQLRDTLLQQLQRWTGAGAWASEGPRRPEVLGLRPLPQYTSPAAAAKALAPRPRVSAADVERALMED